MPVQTDTIKPMSHKITNKKVFQLIIENGLTGKRILDIGAGRGYLVRLLAEEVCSAGGKPRDVITACDYFPEYFKYEEISCERLEFNSELPYPDNSFDAVSAVEVIEHLASPYALIEEAKRVLKPGGFFVLTTPNILNLNSRISYLLNGFYKLFGPLSSDKDALRHCAGHIMPINMYHIVFAFRQLGFTDTRIHIDRLKKSAMAYYFFLAPLIKLSSLKHEKRLRKKHRQRYIENIDVIKRMNGMEILCSRSVVIKGVK